MLDWKTIRFDGSIFAIVLEPHFIRFSISQHPQKGWSLRISGPKHNDLLYTFSTIEDAKAKSEQMLDEIRNESSR